MVAILLLLLICQAFAEKPSLKADVNNDMLAILKTFAVEEISKNMKEIHLLDFESDLIIAKLWAKNITLNVDRFHGNQVDIELVEGTNDFILRGRNLTISGSLALIVKVLFSTYNCKANISVANTGFEARISLMKNKTRLAVEVKSVDISLQKENVGITMACNVMQNVINALITFLKTYFFQSIKSAMSEMLPLMIANSTNTVLSQLPDDVEIMNGVAVKFAFTEAPTVKSSYLVTPINVYAHMIDKPEPPPYEAPDLPDLNPSCTKGFQMFISDFVVRSAVETAHQAGIMSFHKTITAIGFDITVDCKSNSTPSIKFDGTIAFTGSSYCAADFVLHGTTYKFSLGFLADVSAILTETIRNSTIYFEIERMTVTSLKIVFGMIIDLKTLLSFVNMYLEEVRKVINNEIANKGIPIPTFNLFDISDVTEVLIDHYIFVCGTLKPKESLRSKFNYQFEYHPKPYDF